MQKGTPIKSNQNLPKELKNQKMELWTQSKMCSAKLTRHLIEGNMINYKIYLRESLIPNGSINIPKVVEDGMPLVVMKNKFGLDNTAKIVAVLLTKFIKSFNVSKNMTEEQITDYAFTLVEENISGSYENPSLRIDDLMVFFETAKLGRYGRPFDYIDSALIESWLDNYWEERSRKYEQYILVDKWERKSIGVERQIEAEKIPKEVIDKAVAEAISNIQKNSEKVTKVNIQEMEERRKKRITNQTRNLFKNDEEYKEYLKIKEEDEQRKLQKIQESENKSDGIPKDK